MKASRNINDLHPELKKRFIYLRDNWDLHGTPILTATYRDYDNQLEAFQLGVSNAQPGQSLHNHLPALAFDVAFIDDQGVADWNWNLFKEWGRRGEKLGLVWGGRFPGLADGPHLEMPMTWQDAQLGKIPPQLPPLPPPSGLSSQLERLKQALRTLMGLITAR